VLDQGAERFEAHAAAVHFGQESLAFRIHEVHFAEVEDNRASRGRRSQPAPAQLADPRSGQPSFEAQAQFLSAWSNRNLQHS